MTPLSDLPVLIIDCQATGPASAGGRLLEIGWKKIAARDAAGLQPGQVTAHRVTLPDGVTIPRQVVRVTGIEVGQGPDAVEASEAWRLLQKVCGSGPFPTVIHYARFERPFLRRLHAGAGPKTPFPLEIVCTHDIVRRLLPELPRKGLRAVAGHFNYGIGEQRRCADHVAATAWIWLHLSRLLAESAGVGAWPDLLSWLEKTPVPPPCRRYPMDPARLDALPDRPGVYRMRRETGDLLYVGKATSLRRRVASYFRPRTRHPEHILEMLTQARDLAFSETDTALAAAVKEADEIRRRSPPYNRALRTEGKSLAFVSADFLQTAAAPTGECSIGPLPGGRIASALGAISRICGRSSDLPGEFLDAVDLSSDRAPEDRIARAGIDLFLSRHGPILTAVGPGRAMLKIARVLWREKMAAAGDVHEKEASADAAEEAAGIESEWTPERVAGRLEGTLCHGGRMIRRSRWFAVLSESSLSWSPTDGDSRHRHVVVIHRGGIDAADRLAAGRSTPLPPGYRKPALLRRAQIDFAAYQRLRVVTTEIRRLLADGRNPELRISDRVLLGPERLSRMMYWI